MGEKIGVGVSDILYYVPFREFERTHEMQICSVEKSSLFADLCRINTLYMIARAGSGHIGSSFSSLDIMSWLLLNEIRNQESDLNSSARDIFFSSKGHDAPGLYSVLIGLGRLEFELIHKLRRLGGLPGHPDVSTPWIATNTGSLGMGISKAKGMVYAKRILKIPGRVFVLTGDGELQEGQFWESLISAANQELNEIIVIIDHNKLQSDTLLSKVSNLGDLEAKLSSFGWIVSRCDGNNLQEFSEVLASIKKINKGPNIIIADTIKGKGVSFMEHTSVDLDKINYEYHSGAPKKDEYLNAIEELKISINKKLKTRELELKTIKIPSAKSSKNTQNLIQAYSKALIRQAQNKPNIVALDADLVLDTGLIPFKKQFPSRFVECGIAEQDMVSQAGGMALNGLLPIVHSFACFLSARPNEQIYNNATEKSKIIYVGSLAGVIPGGPGHSHQAVRDLSTLAGIPNLTLMEPCCEKEVDLLLDWCINKNSESSYIRITPLQLEISFDYPKNYIPELGKGTVLKEGQDAVIIAYGPVMLSLAIDTSKHLQKEGIYVKVVNIPWLNTIKMKWFREVINDIKIVISIDNHYSIGGQGDRISRVLTHTQSRSKFKSISINNIPPCGNNQEVLNFLEMNKENISKLIKEEL